MKCENCIHYDACKEISDVHGLAFGYSPFCDRFKDKSLFVELPCKVGDKVWCIVGYCDESFEIVERVVTSFTVFENDIELYAGKPNNLSWVSTYDVTKFGKTVFLTQKEAEDKLKEIDENALT